MTRYSPYTWADNSGGGTPITAARLNALEAGVDVDVPVADIAATGTPSSSTYLRGDGTWSTPAGGGATDLEGLSDVDLTTPANRHVLRYESASSQWKNEANSVPVSELSATGTPSSSTYLRGDGTWSTPSGGSSNLDGLSDVTITSVAADNYLRYDSGTSQWVNVAGVPASHITSGTVATARLGSGTASSSTYLRGDQTYAALPTASDTVAGIAEFNTDAEAITGTDTTRATTAANVAAVIAVTRARYSAVNAQTGTTYAPVLSDEGKLVTLSNASSITVTMPQDSTTAFPVGATIDFVGIGAGLVTFSAGTGATVNPTSVTRAQWSAVTAIKRAANTWLIVGDIS